MRDVRWLWKSYGEQLGKNQVKLMEFMDLDSDEEIEDVTII